MMMLKENMMKKDFLILQMDHFGTLMVYILTEKDMINMGDIMMIIKSTYQGKDGMKQIIVIKMRLMMIIMMNMEVIMMIMLMMDLINLI